MFDELRSAGQRIDATAVYAAVYLDWHLDDPAGKVVAAVRPIRDAIDRRVQALVDELVPGGVSVADVD